MVDSGPKSLIYFSTDVESVLMSETEKSCWALAKQGGSLQLPPAFRMLNWMLVRENGSQHNKVVKRCLARLQPQFAISALWVVARADKLLSFLEMACACTVVLCTLCSLFFNLYCMELLEMLCSVLVHIYTTCDNWYYAPALHRSMYICTYNGWHESYMYRCVSAA